MLQAKEEKEERRREREEELARASRYQQVLAAQVHEVQTGRANDPASHVMTAIEASLNRPLLVSMRERKAVKTNHPPPPPPRLGQNGAKQASTAPEDASGCPKLRPNTIRVCRVADHISISGLFSTQERKFAGFNSTLG